MAKLMYEFKNLRITEDGNLAADEMIDYTDDPPVVSIWELPKITGIDYEKKTITFG